jgi:hypothetical protein
MKKCNTAPVEQRSIAAGLLPLKEAVSPYGYPAHTATNSLSLDEGRRCSTRVLRPGLSQIAHPNLPPDSSNLTAAFHYLEAQLTNYLSDKKAA